MCKIIVGLVLLSTAIAFSQENNTSANPDSEYAFMPIKDVVPDTLEKTNAIGVDIMIGTNGFGMGFFYRQSITNALSWTFSLIGSEAKASNEMSYVDIYGQSFTPGKINQLFVFPVMAGLQYRLFKDDLTGTFKPYVCGGVGPNAILAVPYDQPFGWSMSHSRGYFGAGGYVGVGAYFGMDTGTLMGVSIKYYILPMTHGIESMQDEPMANFNTLFITFNVATQY